MNVIILSPLSFVCWERQGGKRSEQKLVSGFGAERILELESMQDIVLRHV